MRVFTGETPGHVYREQLLALLQDGQDVLVRGKKTKELLNCVTEITNPRVRIQIVPGRKLNPWLALSESLWLLAGRNDVASLLPYNKRILEFSDDGKTLYGAYGKRITGQIELMINRLKRDPADRRAVLSIWQPYDLPVNSKDPPCNNLVYFKLRENKLHITVICRSNDLHWGLHAVNLPQFSILQEYIAARLSCEVGTQTHLSNSLHIYTEGEGQKITDRMLAAMDESFMIIPVDALLFPNPWPDNLSHQHFAAMCGAVLDGKYGMSMPRFPFLEFAEDFLKLYRDEQLPIRRENYANLYPSWIRAGREFAPGKFSL